MIGILKALRLINALSIDVALGAVITSRFIQFKLGTQSFWFFDVVLGLAVWIIYTSNHLSDAKKIKGKATSYRHHLHQDYFKAIIIVLVLCSLIAAFLVINFFSLDLIFSGIALLFLVIIHHLIQLIPKLKALMFFKEFRIAILYVIGLSIVSFNENFELIKSDSFILLSIFCIAMLNLILFNSQEEEMDIKDQLMHHSNKISDKRRNTFFYLITILFLITLILILSIQSYSLSIAILSVMGLILVISFFMRENLRNFDLYRILGDGVFLLPVIIL